jgi:putative transposase
MPARNLIRFECENSYYHVYNRGVDKKEIFQDEQDYRVFLKYLKEYLSQPPDLSKIKETFTLQGYTFQGVPHQHKNFYEKIEIIAYCLMPNHFHLELHQKDKQDIQNFMQSISTRYSMYFNKKYERIGPLFQGTYKAVLINDENYLLHLSRYIHLNPSEFTDNLEAAYSSYPEFIGKRKTEWIKPEIVLSYFNKAKDDFIKGANTYQNFVEKYPIDSEKILGKITLE